MRAKAMSIKITDTVIAGLQHAVSAAGALDFAHDVFNKKERDELMIASIWMHQFTRKNHVTKPTKASRKVR
jgi:hypothetical protein